ncbi:MAG: Gfo/Idh/MocA family oxidoreductase [Candidatus Eremiobacteraeota bacterium]|nr:Gfo/Idh/MocA family oxidoreductase [Candidatus Eremiobacteraeota bacterium]
MSHHFRAGIVGTGFGVSAHLPALIAHPRFEVVALASPSSAERVARERGIAAAFPSCQAMLAGIELDVVIVASPPFAHEHDVLASLDALKHVLCEKPFALDVEQARRMVSAAAQAGTACGVAHEFRFVPQLRALEQLVANGHLDPVRNIEATQLRRFLRSSETRPRSWWFERHRGGGIAGAALSHMIDSADWIAGAAPHNVAGFLRTANPKRRDANGEFDSSVDDGAFALLDYGDGRVARLAADYTTSVESYTYAVHGENRTAVASGPSMLELTLFSVDTDETDELQCKPSPYAKFASVNPSVPLLMELYDEFVKAIDGEPNLLPTFSQALETQEVLAAIGY